MQAEILAREGHTCLYRPEYQFSNDCATASTPFSSQEAIYLSPLSTGSPLYSDPPGSTPSHDGSNTSSNIDTGPIKKFKCPQRGCPYASSRQDHVRYHFKAHHEGNRYECDQWYGYAPSLLISLTHWSIPVPLSTLTKGILTPIHARHQERSLGLRARAGVFIFLFDL